SRHGRDPAGRGVLLLRTPGAPTVPGRRLLRVSRTPDLRATHGQSSTEVRTCARGSRPARRALRHRPLRGGEVWPRQRLGRLGGPGAGGRRAGPPGGGARVVRAPPLAGPYTVVATALRLPTTPMLCVNCGDQGPDGFVVHVFEPVATHTLQNGGFSFVVLTAE